jgi:hypothetical protein
VSQQRVMRDVSAVKVKAVESTPFMARPPWVAGSTVPFDLKPERPPAKKGQSRQNSGAIREHKKHA